MKLIRIPIERETDLVGMVRQLKFINLHEGPWVAGGAARRIFLGEELGDGDIDIFMKCTPGAVIAACEMVEKSHKVMTKKRNSIGSVAYQVAFRNFRTDQNFIAKVQVVGSHFFNSLEHMFTDFDYTITQFATDGYELVTTEQAIEDLKTKTIRANTQKEVRGNARHRLLRYIDYGFTPAPGVMRWTLNLGDTTKSITKKLQVEEIDFDY